jgi:hypothetical protein
LVNIFIIIFIIFSLIFGSDLGGQCWSSIYMCFEDCFGL